MDQQKIIDLVELCLISVLTTSAPPLLLGLVVGLVVSIFQTVTSIQEPTLAFVPKIVAVLLSFVLFGSFMQSSLLELFIKLYSDFYYYLH